MPGFVVHTLLGRRLLDAWSASPSTAPFSPNAPSLQLAFFLGCMGPDMGMFPGGDPFVSDLAHYVRSGDLCGTLLAESRDQQERAFAWGWASHVLADRAIHPLINLAAGERQGTGPATYADDPWLHLAIETGVDGKYVSNWSPPSLAGWRSVVPQGAELVNRAYRALYGSAVSLPVVVRSFRAFGRWHPLAAACAEAAAAELFDTPRRFRGIAGGLRRTAKTLSGVFARQSTVHALTHSIPMSASVAEMIDRVITDFPESFPDASGNVPPAFPNVNLDTGLPEDHHSYPPRTKTLARLRSSLGS